MTGLLPPTKAQNRSHWTDWFEISALLSSEGTAHSHGLRKQQRLLSDEDDHGILTDPVTGEALEAEILDEKTDKLVEQVYEEITLRIKLCGDAYPFELHYPEEGAVFSGQFTLRSRAGAITADNHFVFYILALLETGLRDQIIAVADVNTSNHRLGLLFQIASCLAVGGYLRGHSVWFGFPRPEKTAFLPALRSAMTRFGSHKVVEAIPPGFPAALKDGGIDIIAWLDFYDGRGARSVLFAQVASGYDWEGKTLQGFLPKFMNWFMPPAPAPVKPALLIPFPFHHDIADDDDAPWAERANGWLLYQSSDFGVIFDRFRVARCAAVAMAMSPEDRARIDGADQVGAIADWLSELVDEIKEKKAA
ncbi:MAG: hypothetical protein E5X07_15940 [Mesorhizobium sp.]|uniref:hypothetical protein n=1 Tax=Mesorhizobium sp. TaxID=1871066 RepID=UPI0012219C89|nr:hypothetical protein [Mesorhizobium sp.]TIR28757.1 MAG: hypothetical protein E5X35_29535 [Mesorhizobium sp.]TIS23847.1 MAG: hypothetical protein E5X07_15940 [Mesorhizobium sp.]